jgi:hypothetical protein
LAAVCNSGAYDFVIVFILSHGEDGVVRLYIHIVINQIPFLRLLAKMEWEHASMTYWHHSMYIIVRRC